jgi:hypothetical protein
VADDGAQVTAVASPGTGKKTATKAPVQRKTERDDFGAQMAPPIRDKSTSSNKSEGRTRSGPAPITNLFD